MSRNKSWPPPAPPGPPLTRGRGDMTPLLPKGYRFRIRQSYAFSDKLWVAIERVNWLGIKVEETHGGLVNKLGDYSRVKEAVAQEMASQARDLDKHLNGNTYHALIGTYPPKKLSR